MTIIVFQLDDCDWWAGETLTDCIAEARRQCGADSYPDAEKDGYALGDEEMQRLIYVDDSDGAQAPVRRTFAEHLAREVAEGGEFPRLFASTEY